ncbi:hypothetical protein AB432_025790 [Brevibacillus brevis]|uniref:Uncharacterized protein n=1 Tax=Brevibacillus brevis TaxID=1393 RepID=A0A2Z4MPE5_BREBE|nr:hypothetical protein AB432_025790 [Brevibacillus brevis]
MLRWGVFQLLWSGEPSHLFSSRLYPLFVRRISFQACDRTFEQMWLSSVFQTFVGEFQGIPVEIAFSEFNKSLVGRSEFPVQAPLEPDPA